MIYGYIRVSSDKQTVENRCIFCAKYFWEENILGRKRACIRSGSDTR